MEIACPDQHTNFGERYFSEAKIFFMIFFYKVTLNCLGKPFLASTPAVPSGTLAVLSRYFIFPMNPQSGTQVHLVAHVPVLTAIYLFFCNLPPIGLGVSSLVAMK